MTIPYELAFCESYTRECFSGNGRMVDLGCWFGATTFSLARGLRRNWRARNNRLIEGFDLFVWNKWMDPVADHIEMPRDVPMREKASSKTRRSCSLATRNVVRLYQQDLMEYEPDTGAGGITFHRCYEILAAGKKDRDGIFSASNSGHVGRRTAGFHLPQPDRGNEPSAYVADCEIISSGCIKSRVRAASFSYAKKESIPPLCRRWNRNRFRSKKSIRRTNTAEPASSRTTGERTSRRRSYCSWSSAGTTTPR